MKEHLFLLNQDTLVQTISTLESGVPLNHSLDIPLYYVQFAMPTTKAFRSMSPPCAVDNIPH